LVKILKKLLEKLYLEPAKKSYTSISHVNTTCPNQTSGTAWLPFKEGSIQHHEWGYMIKNALITTKLYSSFASS
jgi:hypothetical protein